MSIQATDWVAFKIPPDRKVKLAARMVLTAFARRADEHGRAAYPALSTVAWELGCTERNVADHVKALTHKGLLIISPDQSPAANIPVEYRPVVYDLPIDLVRVDEKPQRQQRGRKPKSVDLDLKDSSAEPELGMKDSAIRPEENFPLDLKDSSISHEENFIQIVPQPSGKQSGNKSSLLPQQPPLLAPVEDLPEDAAIVDPFDELYDAYPQTGGLKYARDAFNDVMSKQLIDYPTLLLAVRNYAADPEVQRKLATPTERQYIPQLKRWLEDKRWKTWANPPTAARAKADQKFVENLSSAADPYGTAQRLSAALSRYKSGNTSSAPDQIDTTPHTPQLGAA